MTGRVGFGVDLHRLVKGRPLRLGGVTIPHAKGLLGHSDADVVLHAVTSAILGAVGAGDLGDHFSDRDPRWKGVAGGVLVRQALQLAARRGYGVGNVDVTVVAEAPRLTPHKPAVRAALARLLQVPAGAVNVKATTWEGLGPIGRGQAMAAYAVVNMTANRPSRIAHHRRTRQRS